MWDKKGNWREIGIPAALVLTQPVWRPVFNPVVELYFWKSSFSVWFVVFVSPWKPSWLIQSSHMCPLLVLWLAAQVRVVILKGCSFSLIDSRCPGTVVQLCEKLPPLLLKVWNPVFSVNGHCGRWSCLCFAIFFTYPVLTVTISSRRVFSARSAQIYLGGRGV